MYKDFCMTGSTFDPEGQILNDKGREVSQADLAMLSEVAACSALCNSSSLYYDKGRTSALTPRLLICTQQDIP